MVREPIPSQCSPAVLSRFGRIDDSMRRSCVGNTRPRAIAFLGRPGNSENRGPVTALGLSEASWTNFCVLQYELPERREGV